MEKAVAFGTYDNLLGIWNENIGEAVRDVAVIFVTPGMLHHAGPFRLHVDLSRRLIDHQIPSLRFDLSGIGESLAVGNSGSSLDRASSEIRQAIDWIEQQKGTKNVILFGLCSGADDALHAALNDDRIIGLVAMDGCGYRTKRFHLHRLFQHVLPRVLSPQKWRSLIGRKLSKSQSVPKSLQQGSDIREFPDRETAQSQLKSLADRNTQAHFVYTGGISEYYNYAGQFKEMFPLLANCPSVTSVYFPTMDHVALLCEDRAALVEHVVSTIVKTANNADVGWRASPAAMPPIFDLGSITANDLPYANSWQ